MKRLARGLTLLASIALVGTLFGGQAASPARAQTGSGLPDQVVIFVIDLSGSMNEEFDGERSKLDVAKEAFVEAFTNVSPDAYVGLRVYGDQLPARGPAAREENCTEDTRLAVPITQVDRDSLIAEVEGFTALGDTPIALALRAANDDIPEGTLGTVVLFSDGRDECFDADLDGDPGVGPSWGEDPCVVAREIGGEGVDLRIDRIETVGFRADAAAELELRCIADSTGGSFTAIESPEDARDLLPELLAQISSPRPAERLGGTPIVGTPSPDGAPSLERLDAAGAGDGRYTDTIEMNTEKWYRVGEYGPGAGTFTATVFGLPAQEGISFTMRLEIPANEQVFFEGRGDDDAGLPRRPTASIRCPGCSVTGGPHEAYWVLTLQTDNPDLGGTYDLEILTEGPAFGGVSISCEEPQECWYEQEIAVRSGELAALQEQYEAMLAEAAVPEGLILERDALQREAAVTEEQAVEAAAEADRLAAEAAELGDGGSDLVIPILLAAAGVGLAGLALVRRRGADAGGDG